MQLEIVWKGNEHTNSSDRKGEIPAIIVNHISAQSLTSLDAWYTCPDNKISSAHFAVSKNGTVHQYVTIERMAFSQGLEGERIALAPAFVVREKGMNPNRYAVSIEHEGMDGLLTEEQYQACLHLHRYIQRYVMEKWGHWISLDYEHVLGHFQIDAIRKANCPGPNFPWSRLYEDMRQMEEG